MHSPATTRVAVSLAATALAMTALATTASAAPGKVATTCHGKTPTIHITTVSQLNDWGDGVYEVQGTPKNDVVLVDMELPDGAEALLVSMYNWRVWQTTTITGGTDDVCVTLRNGGAQEVSIYGGTNVTASGADFTRFIGYAGGTVSLNSPRLEMDLRGRGSYVATATNDSSQRVLDAEIYGSDGNDTITVNVPAVTQKSTVAIDGADGNDTITVNAPSLTTSLIVGGAGKDTITTGASQDLVYGSPVTYSGSVSGTGAVSSFSDATAPLRNSHYSALPDVVHNDASGDTSGNIISTGAGDDRVYGSNGYDEIRTGSGNDWADGAGARDRLWGGEGNDTLYGGSGNDDAYGENGDDTLYGGSGNDLIKGGKGGDTIRGESGNDELYGNEDDDNITGSDGDDELYGNDGDDYLRGNDGDDYLQGDSGTDDCSGGGGSDTLKFCNP